MITIETKEIHYQNKLTGEYTPITGSEDVNDCYFYIKLSSGDEFYVPAWWSREDVEATVSSTVDQFNDRLADDDNDLQETLEGL